MKLMVTQNKNLQDIQEVKTQESKHNTIESYQRTRE